jgi:hypothetical protein
MNEPTPLDLSPLGTEADPGHWQEIVVATMARVDAVLARRAQDPLSLIASWTRPLLLAAAVALAVLVPVEIVLESHEERAEQVRRLVDLSSHWRRGEPPPSSADFLRALAEADRP